MNKERHATASNVEKTEFPHNKKFFDNRFQQEAVAAYGDYEETRHVEENHRAFHNDLTQVTVFMLYRLFSMMMYLCSGFY